MQLLKCEYKSFMRKRVPLKFPLRTPWGTRTSLRTPELYCFLNYTIVKSLNEKQY